MGEWRDRKVYIAVLICQTIGLTTSITLPTTAISKGVLGNLIVFTATYIVIGIPLLYLEMVISQFTQRNCLNVWQVRPCLSHVGYVLVGYQCLIVLFNHIIVSFVLHYLTVTFEHPVPYSVCGPWADEYCNSVTTNYTVNENCLKNIYASRYRYCQDLAKTFPEYQYMRYKLLATQDGFNIVWRVIPSSGVVCILTYIGCFKRQESLKYFVWFLLVFPFAGYFVFLIGSMLQKGVVVIYLDAIDANFEDFTKQIRITQSAAQAIYALSIGSGATLTLAGNSNFRTPCYSNAIIAVFLCAVFTILAVCTKAMMLCPYAYELSQRPRSAAVGNLTLLLERVPRLLTFYDEPTLWLVIIYSSNAVLGMRTSIILFYNIQEVISSRSQTVAQYPGLFCFIGVFILFFATIPFFSTIGLFWLSNAFRRYLNLVSILAAVLEMLVFVVWYGIDRLSEDVYFMQGVQPSTFMKIVWLTSPLILIYIFAQEFYYRHICNKPHNLEDNVGYILFMVIVLGTVAVTIAKLVYAACRKRLKQCLGLDPSWQPPSELLVRSRAMFTRQAMTKEYLYRQYHLQAGINARQRRSNARAPLEAQCRRVPYI